MKKTVVLKKHETKVAECAVCGSDSKLTEVNGKHICQVCLYKAMARHQEGEEL